MSMKVVAGEVQCVGFEELTGISGPKALQDIPTGVSTPTHALIQAETQNVKWRGDGTAPTTVVGMLLAAGSSIVYDGELANLQFIEVTATGKVNITYFRSG